MTQTALAEPAAKPTAALAFRDVAGCKAWLATLPLANAARMQELLGEQLAALAASSDVPPRERARIADRLRDKVQFVHRELARRFAGRPLPLSPAERQAFRQVGRLWQGLWDNFTACLPGLLARDESLAGYEAPILHRGLVVGRQLLLLHAQARRAPPPEVWLELHAYYRWSELIGCAEVPVRDRLAAASTTCSTAFVHTLMLDRADPCSLSPRQLELADRWLAGWARKVRPDATPMVSVSPLLAVDLEQPHGFAAIDEPPAQPPPTLRYATADRLLASVRSRIRRLRAGADPIDLGLGEGVTDTAALALLEHLAARWSESPGVVGGPSVNDNFQLATGGLLGVYFRLTGRTFALDADGTEQEVRQRTGGAASTFGVVETYDPDRERAERDWPWELWGGDLVGGGGSLGQAPGARSRWQLDQITLVRHASGRLSLARVRWLAEQERGLRASLAVWPGAPEAMRLRAAAPMAEGDRTVPAVYLPPAGREPATLIVPLRFFRPEREAVSVQNPDRRFVLRQVLERGTDFDRVTFES